MLASLSQTQPAQPEVKLLMESRGFAPNTLNTFSKTWSKLFQVGPYFVDLSCTPEGNKASFSGQIIFEKVPTKLQISLLKGEQRLSPELGPSGSFKLAIQEPGVHALELDLGNTHVLIGDLALS